MAASAPTLKKNAIGMWQIVFFVIAAAAPLTACWGYPGGDTVGQWRGRTRRLRRGGFHSAGV